ncbi:MAG: hypothetical protein IKO98_08980 [Bacteroidales bacterium]|nr:hypothetical protein [Bacteroidales bacterium]
MLLKDDLYQIIDSEKSEDSSTYTLLISETSPLFKGHFPGNPVLPGVCILQIFKELVETDLAFEQPIMYDEIKHCKFHLPIAMNKPFKAKVSLSLKQDGNFWNLSASLKNDAAIFTTLKAVLTTIKQDIHD